MSVVRSSRPTRLVASLALRVLLPVLLLGLLAGPWLAVPATAAGDGSGGSGGRAASSSAGEVGLDARSGAALERCARPALLPALRVPRGASEVRGVAAAAHREGLPARAQALALAAVLSDDLAAAAVEGFYRRLTRTDGWESLPPTLALHRVLGTPDPFAYERLWPQATSLLAELTRRPEAQVALAVAPGGGAPRSCAPTPLRRRTLPLPPGSAYAVAGGATRSSGLVLEAPCGTPVLAASSGEVTIDRDDPDGGPWVLTVTGAAGATRYRHVQAPLVANSDVVTAGQQIAEVGDLGAVDDCALGVATEDSSGADRSTTEVVRWLLSGTPRVTRLAELADEVDRQRDTPGRPPRRGRTQSGSSAAVTPSPSPAPVPQLTVPTPFRVGTFNVLGAHLTAPGGGKPGFGPGPVRMARGLARIEASGASVVVLNEFEDPAAAVVTGDGAWQLHRATPNNRFRGGNTNGNAVAWRSDTWSAVTLEEFTVPWKVTLHMPVVTLEHRRTGARVTVVGVHNPASTRKAGNQSGARAVARRVELAQVAALRRADPSTPVVVAGDFNERSEVYCAFLGAGLKSSAPRPAGARCRAPGHSVDWVFGTTGLTFGGEVVDRSTLGSISDHPLITAAVSLSPQLR